MRTPTIPSRLQNSRLSKEKEVSNIKRAVCSLGKASYSHHWGKVLFQCRELCTSRVPDARQGLILQAGLSKDSSSGLSVKIPFARGYPTPQSLPPLIQKLPIYQPLRIPIAPVLLNKKIIQALSYLAKQKLTYFPNVIKCRSTNRNSQLAGASQDRRWGMSSARGWKPATEAVHWLHHVNI